MTRFFLIALFCIILRPVNSMAAAERDISGKIITVIINETGLAIMGRDTLTMDDMITEIRTRLWKSYLGTGKMYDAIEVDFSGSVAEEVKTSAIKAIHEAQQKALIDICLQKHKRLFADMNSGQQKKIEKQFPVLFQSVFSNITAQK